MARSKARDGVLIVAAMASAMAGCEGTMSSGGAGGASSTPTTGSGPGPATGPTTGPSTGSTAASASGPSTSTIAAASTGATVSSGTGGLGQQLELMAGALGGRGNLEGPSPRYWGPQGVVNDGAGGLYIADSSNGTIRKLEIATGLTTTIAGTPGKYGFEDGIGATARFVDPRGLALSGGNLYVAEFSASTIRKIELATGAVTTLAGSPTTYGNVDGIGAAASFFFPHGLAADGAGNLYVADSQNALIRKIVLATGEVTTYAGTGMSGIADGVGTSAEFSSPVGLVFEAGNLYVADTWSVIPGAAIRRISLTDATVTTIAGDYLAFGGNADGVGTQASFCDLRGITSDGAGNLYTADACNTSIRKVVTSTQQVTTIAGATAMYGSEDGVGSAAQFNEPRFIDFDGAGGLIISDGPFNPGAPEGNHTIRKLALTSGHVSTISGVAPKQGHVDGIGTVRFSQPERVVTDGAGNAYIADLRSGVIRKVVVSTGETTTVASGFSEPCALALAAPDSLYVSSCGDRNIRLVVPSTGVVTTVDFQWSDGSTAEFDGLTGLAADGEGHLYLALPLYQIILRADLGTLAIEPLAGEGGTSGTDDGIGAAARFSFPRDLAWDGLGNLYVADTWSNTIRKIVVSTGEVTTIAGTPGVAGSADGTGAAALFDHPSTITVDSAGDLVIVDYDNYTVRKLVPSTGVVTTWIGQVGRAGIVLGPLPATLNAPSGVAALPSNQLLITDSAEHSLLIVR